MEYKIEKNIEIFETSKKVSKYPFGDMEVNDSFIIANDNSDTSKYKIRSAIAYYRRKNKDKKFAFRETEDLKLRIWRTE